MNDIPGVLLFAIIWALAGLGLCFVSLALYYISRAAQMGEALKQTREQNSR